MSPPPETRSAIQRLLRGGSIYTLATAVQLGAGVLVLPALTRILDTGEYGTVTAALVIYNLLGSTVGLGLSTAIARAYFHADDRPFGREGAVGLIWATAVVAVGLAGLLELSGPGWSSVYEGLEYGAPLRLAVWSAAAFAVFQASQSVLRADERPAPYVVGAALATAGAQAAGLAGAAIGGVSGYMAGVGVGVLLAAVYSITATGALGSVGFHPDVVRRNLRIGIPTVPHALALYVLAAGDRIVIERLEGVTEVARYHVAFLIGFVVILLGAGINNAWSPIVYGAQEDNRWRVLADTTATVVRVTALAAAAVAILAPLALEVAAPGGYELDGLDDITVLVAASAVLYVGYLASAHVVLWQGATWWLALITPLVAAFNVGLNFVLIPAYGLIGAAVATVISYTLLAVTLLVVTRRIAPVSWPWRSAAISMAFVAAVAAIGLAAPDDGIWLVLRGGAGVAIAATIVWRVSRAAYPRPEPAPAA